MQPQVSTKVKRWSGSQDVIARKSAPVGEFGKLA